MQRAGHLLDNIQKVSEATGTSRSALLRRIVRRVPDILERVRCGEFKSVRLAAIEAGIIKIKSPIYQCPAALGSAGPPAHSASPLATALGRMRDNLLSGLPGRDICPGLFFGSPSAVTIRHRSCPPIPLYVILYRQSLLS